MKKTIILFSLFVALLGNTALKAQTAFEVPKNFKLETDADFAKYEKDIIAAAKWLEETDLDKEADKRAEVNFFVLAWVSGSPLVSIELTSAITDLCEDNNPLLGIYLAAYSSYVLEHKNEKGKFAPTKAAVKSLIKVYSKGIAIKKNKAMKALIKMDDKGEIDKYIIETMEVAKD